MSTESRPSVLYCLGQGLIDVIYFVGLLGEVGGFFILSGKCSWDTRVPAHKSEGPLVLHNANRNRNPNPSDMWTVLKLAFFQYQTYDPSDLNINQIFHTSSAW